MNTCHHILNPPNSWIVWHLWSLKVWRHPSDFTIKKSGVILIGQNVYFTWSFPLVAFNILFWFCTCGVFIIMCCGKFLFSCSIFDVLYVSCTLVSTSFSRLWKCSMIFVKNTLCAFELGFFFFLYFYYSWIWSFHSVPDLLDDFYLGAF